MPDHMHLLWLGLDEHGSDQRIAVEFLRKQLRVHLAPAEWQHQPHDNVLRESDRERAAFASIAHYILENPVRAGLAGQWQDYLYTGSSVPGYPALELRDEGYWELFWRIYTRSIESH
jgi:putative transposase